MKYILIIVLALLLMGCSRTNYRHTTSREISNETLTQQKQTVREEQTSAARQTDTSQDTQTETIDIEFDTDKPLNPDTGLPPVKKVSYTGIRKNEVSKTDEQINNQVNEQSEEENNLSVNRQTESEQEKETEVKPARLSLGRVLLLIVAIIGFYWIHDVIRNKMKGKWIK